MSSRYTVSPGVAVSLETATEPSLIANLLSPDSGTGKPAIKLDLAGARDDATLTVDGRYKGIAWSCDILRTRTSWQLGFRSTLFREYLAFHIALLPALRFELAERKVALVNGAAYQASSGVTVISGPTGTGKTSLLLGSLAAGARFLGDEYVGLGAQGDVSPVVRALALRRGSLGLLPGAMAKLSLSRRVALITADIAATMTARRLEPLNHVRPQELGLAVVEADSAKTDRIVWLERSRPGDSVELEMMNPDDLSERFVEAAANHQRLYRDVSPDLELVAPGGEESWRQALQGALSQSDCYRLRYSSDRMREALDVLGTVSA